jgi:hypothetical protein
MCSALLPVTAVNDQSQVVLQSCFESYGAFDSGAGDSVQRSCNLIVKGLLLTRAVFPSFKVPKPLQWDAHWVSTISRPKATGSRIPIRASPVEPPALACDVCTICVALTRWATGLTMPQST